MVTPVSGLGHVGGVAEMLMVAASRQYIRGWQAETTLVHAEAAWYLTEALWRTSEEMHPGLEPDHRWRSIETLLAPVSSPDVPAPAKAALLGLIFQLLLVADLGELLPAGTRVVPQET